MDSILRFIQALERVFIDAQLTFGKWGDRGRISQTIGFCRLSTLLISEKTLTRSHGLSFWSFSFAFRLRPLAAVPSLSVVSMATIAAVECVISRG